MSCKFSTFDGICELWDAEDIQFEHIVNSCDDEGYCLVEDDEDPVMTIGATERSSEGYNYEFDEMRRSVHDEIVNNVGRMPHTRAYTEFHRALRDLCEEMLPERFPPQKITKLDAPMLGMNRS